MKHKPVVPGGLISHPELPFRWPNQTS